MTSSLTTTLARHYDALSGMFSEEELPSLRDALAQVPDPRARRGVRYRLTELLLVCVAAVLSGAKSLLGIEEWAQDASLRGMLPTLKRAPSQATLHRIVTRVDPVVLDAAVNGWVRHLVTHTNADPHTLRAVAIDGKEVRGAKNGSGNRVFLMAAYEHASGAVIGQESVGEKTNEIPHLPYLLDRLGSLRKTVITVDALHTLPQQAAAIIGRGGHYLFTVKGNAKKLRDRISAAPWGRQVTQYRLSEIGHGRVSSWEVMVLPATKRIDFPGAVQIMQLRRGRSSSEHATGETVYVITSLPPAIAGPEGLATLLRGHWGIENRVHWVRDTAYGEDVSQVRTGNAAHVMATFRNVALSVHRLIGHESITATLRVYGRRPELATQLTRL